MKLKIFDANVGEDLDVGKKSLRPGPLALIFIRDPVTKEPTRELEAEVKPVADGFYEVVVPKGVLIEQMSIPLDVPGAEYNPATITKLVTANHMQIYPGASKSEESFSPQAYVAQLAAYKSLMENAVAAAAGQRERVAARAKLIQLYAAPLAKMAAVPGRLLDPTPGETEIAAKALREVAAMYGIELVDAQGRPVGPDAEPEPRVVYVPVPVETTPDEPNVDAQVAASWVSYNQGQAAAERLRRSLVVLVGVGYETRCEVVHNTKTVETVVCTATESEAKRFPGPGVYRMKFIRGKWQYE